MNLTQNRATDRYTTTTLSNSVLLPTGQPTPMGKLFMVRLAVGSVTHHAIMVVHDDSSLVF